VLCGVDLLVSQWQVQATIQSDSYKPVLATVDGKTKRRSKGRSPKTLPEDRLVEISSKGAGKLIFSTLAGGSELLPTFKFVYYDNLGVYESSVDGDRLIVKSIPSLPIRVKHQVSAELFCQLSEGSEDLVACSHCRKRFACVSSITGHWASEGCQCPVNKAVILVTDQPKCNICGFNSIRKADMERHRCEPVRPCLFLWCPTNRD